MDTWEAGKDDLNPLNSVRMLRPFGLGGHSRWSPKPRDPKVMAYRRQVRSSSHWEQTLGPNQLIPNGYVLVQSKNTA